MQGAAHMGCDPAVLAGSIPIDQGRRAFEGHWGVRLPLTSGPHLLQMMDTVARTIGRTGRIPVRVRIVRVSIAHQPGSKGTEHRTEYSVDDRALALLALSLLLRLSQRVAAARKFGGKVGFR